MKAAVIAAAGMVPVWGEFATPVAKQDEVLVKVHAAALSNFSKSRSEGEHYSSDGVFPRVAGVDGVGVTPEGKRVYFVLPESPYGSLAEYCPIDTRRTVAIPDGLDDITAAAIANPGMSVWSALVGRAKLLAGETVLINGATSTAGRIAVQVAKYLGAGKVIATARNAAELEEVKALGADIVVPFDLHSGADAYEATLKDVLTPGVDVVVDYLWGESAKTVLVAIAKTAEDGHETRFVHVGAASHEETIALPGAALRAAAISLMGSGVGSVEPRMLLRAIESIFGIVQPAGLKIATTVRPVAEIETVWPKAPNKPRLVFQVG